MCLAVPMKIIELSPTQERLIGKVDLEGSSYEVDLSLIDNPELGDYVIIHAGIAIEKLNRQEADYRLELFDKLVAIYRKETGQDVQLIAPVNASTSINN